MPTTDVQTKQPVSQAAKPYKGTAMEGLVAKWYANVRKGDPDLERVVRQVDDMLPTGSRILEVAPGPGYLAIELAKLGKYQVVGVDISKAFIQIAQAKAREAGVAVDFQRGNASNLPFEAGSFDFIICRAAFKNFTEPVEALREMYRVLRPGGKATIHDLRRDASLEDIDAEVSSMGLNWLNKLLTKWTFRTMLLKNAYTRAEIQQFLTQTDFARYDIRENKVGMEIWMEK
jgi:ubiquinone/menaquinone biosynthesis C-methylase UbiE